MSGLDEFVLGTWAFQRQRDLLTIERRSSEDGFVLVVSDTRGERTLRFREFQRLVVFQSDMETFLIRTGWSLADFTPDRRVTDRRSVPRVTPDRRRWWTDVWRMPR